MASSTTWIFTTSLFRCSYTWTIQLVLDFKIVPCDYTNTKSVYETSYFVTYKSDFKLESYIVFTYAYNVFDVKSLENP